HFFSHQGFDWDGIHNAFEVANALNAKNNTMLEDDVFAMQNKFEQSNELSYFENNLLFKDQDMIANNELFLPLIKELLIPMLEQFDKYEI
ncbi:MAG: hypothetical protein N4Q32_04815, partial [Neisseriaceae bacterium]|nr:hypothetical protein [Neisseriaceae bacterium]